jgi:hypothetical protein
MIAAAGAVLIGPAGLVMGVGNNRCSCCSEAALVGQSLLHRRCWVTAVHWVHLQLWQVKALERLPVTWQAEFLAVRGRSLDNQSNNGDPGCQQA